MNQFNLENDPLVSFIPGVKVVILAGGLGSRLSEETTVRPKPMVEIGGLPILWHILKGYEHHGFNDFVIALGYKGEFIKDYFLRYRMFSANLTVDLATGKCESSGAPAENWKLELVDTCPSRFFASPHFDLIRRNSLRERSSGLAGDDINFDFALSVSLENLGLARQKGGR